MNRNSATEDRATRFDVQSADGTSVAVWVDGSGPPLVLVHGALSDHISYAVLVN
jgi:pimeloyl-ACP methyl ester carboxylesterase